MWHGCSMKITFRACTFSHSSQIHVPHSMNASGSCSGWWLALPHAMEWRTTRAASASAASAASAAAASARNRANAGSANSVESQRKSTSASTPDTAFSIAWRSMPTKAAQDGPPSLPAATPEYP